MSEFAFLRFSSHNILTQEEQGQKEKIIQLTKVLQAKRIKCDASISKIAEGELGEILEKVRELPRKKEKQSDVEVLKDEQETYLYNR
jgi:hypothetical protein